MTKREKPLFLFCYWQKTNIQNKYIAISVIDNGEQNYDLYEIPYDIEYENTCDSYGQDCTEFSQKRVNMYMVPK